MPAPTPRTEHELNVIANAVEWTCVRGRGASRTVSRHPTQSDAHIAAVLDGRSMIYAIDAHGLSAHVENI